VWVFPFIFMGIMLATLIYATRKAVPSRSAETVYLLTLLNWLFFFLLSPKALPTYRLAVLPFFLAYATARIAKKKYVVVGVGLYSVALSIHYTFWEDWVKDVGYLATAPATFVYFLLVVIVGFEVFAVSSIACKLLSDTRSPPSTTGQST